MVSQMKAPATSDIVRYPYACREGRLECRAHQSNDEPRLGQGPASEIRQGVESDPGWLQTRSGPFSGWVSLEFQVRGLPAWRVSWDGLESRASNSS